MLHDTLWNENAGFVRRCLEHPFVRRLAAGTLDRETFRRYVAQDAFFLRAFFRAYGLAAARCDDFDHARRELMASVLDELKLHTNYAKTLDINLDDVQPYAATSAYTEFLLRIAWHNSVAEITGSCRDGSVYTALHVSRQRTNQFTAPATSVRRLDQDVFQRRVQGALCSTGITSGRSCFGFSIRS